MKWERNQLIGRRAFTLVELLVVVGVISVLAAITLPSIRTMLHGQKVNQAARMVQAHIESTRLRAMATGKYTAVVFERQANSPDAVVRLAVGNVFPPYEGDIVGALGTLSDGRARIDASSTPVAPPVPGRYGPGTDGFYDTITIGPLDGSLVKVGTFLPGDFINIGEQRNLFVINSVSTDSSGRAVVTFNNPPVQKKVEPAPLSESHWPSREPLLPTVGTPTTVPFRIFRQPTKSLAPSTILPRGTCIDMSVSGIGPTGTQFTGTVPIMIVFDGRGNISYISDGTGAYTPDGIVHLLVGRIEQVFTATPNLVKDPLDSTSVDSNLNDEGNIWVSINPYAGTVYSSQVVTGGEGGTVPVRLRAARTFATNAVTASEG